MAEHHHAHADDVHHEESDVDIRGIFGFAAGLLIVAVFVYLFIFGLFKYFDARENVKDIAQYPLAAGQENRTPPEPRLQTDPRQDLADLRAKEDDLLGSYGWVDKNAEVVRLPIEQAMKLTLERGLPARQQGKP
jgi:hypothetical protein